VKTYLDYKLLVARIEAVAVLIGNDTLYDDMCVNSENIYDADTFNFSSSQQDWSSMVSVAELTFGMRCEEIGLNANDYGFNY
jgi:hypothetical protein